VTSPENDVYRDRERAALALATALCPQEVHCQACRNEAADLVWKLARGVAYINREKWPDAR
jgi:hypothetical protein